MKITYIDVSLGLYGKILFVKYSLHTNNLSIGGKVLTIILVVWGLIAIGHAYGAWWIVALLLLLFLPRNLNKIVMYFWAGLAIAASSVGCWLIVFCALAVIDVLTVSSD